MSGGLSGQSACLSEALQGFASDGWDPADKESEMGSEEMKSESKAAVWS